MHYSRRTWCCPFFRFDEKNAVHCEDGSVVKLKDDKLFAEFAERYCGDVDGWKTCQLAKYLKRCYEARKETAHDRTGKTHGPAHPQAGG